jgi:hypothetical protein
MSRAPSIVPIQLGCCPEPHRCDLCPPPTNPPTPEVVTALRETARAPDLPVFFGGPPPTDPLVAALGGRPFAIKVRPDLFRRHDLDRLAARGLTEVELDALSFDDAAVHGVGRPHRAAQVRAIADALHARGLRVGISLTPGLPGQSADVCREDAEIAAERFDFARLLPVLVLAGSGLDRRHAAGFYRPLSLGEAVAICRDMLERFEARQVPVIRVGLQPGPDGFGRAIAGPRHSSLRELIEAERTRERLRALLDDVPRGAYVRIRCAPGDESRTRGPLHQHVRSIRADLGLRAVTVVCDDRLARGELAIDLLED